MEFLFHYAVIIIFLKSHHLESVLISYSCTLQNIIIFHGDPTTPTPKSRCRDSPGLTHMATYTIADWFNYAPYNLDFTSSNLILHNGYSVHIINNNGLLLYKAQLLGAIGLAFNTLTTRLL